MSTWAITLRMRKVCRAGRSDRATLKAFLSILARYDGDRCGCVARAVRRARRPRAARTRQRGPRPPQGCGARGGRARGARGQLSTRLDVAGHDVVGRAVPPPGPEAGRVRAGLRAVPR